MLYLLLYIFTFLFVLLFELPLNHRFSYFPPQLYQFVLLQESFTSLGDPMDFTYHFVTIFQCFDFSCLCFLDHTLWFAHASNAHDCMQACSFANGLGLICSRVQKPCVSGIHGFKMRTQLHHSCGYHSVKVWGRLCRLAGSILICLVGK